ncbi:hypothetical protein [Tunturiibacter gelidoferens]|uniref:hypothetical protein n=1 Tax=Tunturiibacter gelidiferens TaxID=3069689 RepID=UPI0015CA50EC|nr:hypothetical protein [Edaphobacter lichenicola]
MADSKTTPPPSPNPAATLYERPRSSALASRNDCKINTAATCSITPFVLSPRDPLIRQPLKIRLRSLIGSHKLESAAGPLPAQP